MIIQLLNYIAEKGQKKKKKTWSKRNPKRLSYQLTKALINIEYKIIIKKKKIITHWEIYLSGIAPLVASVESAIEEIVWCNCNSSSPLGRNLKELIQEISDSQYGRERERETIGSRNLCEFILST